MDVLSIVKSGIQTLKNNAGNSLTTFQFRKKTGSTYTNGKNSPTFATSKNILGLISKFKVQDVDGINVKYTDTLALLFIDSNSDVPSIGDEITNNGTLYQVIKPMPTYVGDVAVICEVHLRS